jgi:hypothetical protein
MSHLYLCRTAPLVLYHPSRPCNLGRCTHSRFCPQSSSIAPCPAIISEYDFAFPVRFHFARFRDCAYLCMQHYLPLIWTILAFPVYSSPISYPWSGDAAGELLHSSQTQNACISYRPTHLISTNSLSCTIME